jgi:Fumarylacetoacetase N-terminal
LGIVQRSFSFAQFIMYAEHFSIENIPYGIASSTEHPQKTVATRFQDAVIFLDELAKFNPPQISGETLKSFSQVSKRRLNPFEMF